MHVSCVRIALHAALVVLVPSACKRPEERARAATAAHDPLHTPEVSAREPRPEPAAATTSSATGPAREPPVAPGTGDPADAEAAPADPHAVAFADRSSQGYLLLLAAAPPEAVDRALVRELVRKRFREHARDEEVRLALELIDAREGPTPIEPLLSPDGEGNASGPRRRDLLGFHLELLSEPDTRAIVPDGLLADPVAARSLTPAERAALGSHRVGILVRADYRNQHGVRGLRLLQAIVDLIARHTRAVIHDPDTGETQNPETFFARRYLKDRRNVADQVIVMPLASRGAEASRRIRLVTRGMRRFGCPDLELDGLPRDPALLQEATHLLYGLASTLVGVAEVDPRGLAVLVQDALDVTHADVAAAYATRNVSLPRCSSCPAHTRVHLVERPAEDADPTDHLVVRVVAPREQSDAPSHDHVAWLRGALDELLGSSRR